MSASVLPDLTAEDLLALKDQLETWAAVRQHLGLSPDQLMRLRKRLGCYESPRDPATKKPSAIDPYLDQLRELTAQGMTCPEMVEALNLPVQPEQLRRQLHQHGIQLLAKRGAQPGEKNWAWKGGRIVDKDGYILIHQPDHPNANSGGYVREHRLVMEAELGRYLDPKEVVHHIDGDTSNNDPGNLELFDDNPLHLAVTLKGKPPKHSEDGKRRMSENGRRTQAMRRERQEPVPAPIP